MKTIVLFLGLMLLLAILPGQSFAQQMGLLQGDWAKYELTIESSVDPIDDLLVENVKTSLSIPPADCSIYEIEWVKVEVLDFENGNPVLEKSLSCNGEEIIAGTVGSNHGYYAPINLIEGYVIKDGTLDPPTFSDFEERMYGNKKVPVAKFYTETIKQFPSGMYENYKTYYFEKSSGLLLENSFQIISENQEVMDDIDLTVGYKAVEFSIPRENPLLSIDAQTNKSFYDYGENVGVSGMIRNFDFNVYPDTPLDFRVLDPTGNLTKMGQASPSQEGVFSFNFMAEGMQFEKSGGYTIQLVFGLVEDEIPMFLVGASDFQGGDLAPNILQLQDIKVFAEAIDERVMVSFDVVATDDVDEKINTTCKPVSGFLFGVGETIVKCTARDSAGNLAMPMSFTVRVHPPQTSIPDWVRNNAEWWAQDAIGDNDFVSGIQFLIEEEIMAIPETSHRQENGSQEIPSWIKNNADWWSQGLITDSDFVKGIQYLVEQGIIKV